LKDAGAPAGRTLGENVVSGPKECLEEKAGQKGEDTAEGDHTGHKKKKKKKKKEKRPRRLFEEVKP